jgi:hypothetical protein
MKDSREISNGVGSWEILFGLKLCSLALVPSGPATAV